jgi:hypothetical protein
MRDAAPALQYRDKDYGIPKREKRQVRVDMILDSSPLTCILSPLGRGKELIFNKINS